MSKCLETGRQGRQLYGACPYIFVAKTRVDVICYITCAIWFPFHPPSWTPPVVVAVLVEARCPIETQPLVSGGDGLRRRDPAKIISVAIFEQKSSRSLAEQRRTYGRAREWNEDNDVCFCSCEIKKSVRLHRRAGETVQRIAQAVWKISRCFQLQRNRK
ncbi:hypothetical protein CBL_07542 [Carabus blaptoides fortunei]